MVGANRLRVKKRLKWKTVFSKWGIVLKYTIKLELTIKHNKQHNNYVI